MKTIPRSIGLTLILISLAGCATIFGDNDRTVKINSDPQGAKVYLNNNYIGTTPTMVVMQNIWHPSELKIEQPGQQPFITAINSKFQPVGLWNILFWPGFIVDAISGDMMKIAPNDKSVLATFSKA